MKILITGPRGFIATRLLQILKKQTQYEIVELDRDLGADAFPQFFEKHRFDAVIHLATLFLKTHVFSQISSLVDSNVTLTTQLLECSKTSGVKHFVSFGTYYEFPRPASLYASMKAAAKPILDYYAETTEIQITELALYDTYGPGDTRAKILNFLIEAARKAQELPLSPGHQKMKLLYVDDICRAILHSLKMAHSAKSVARYAVEPLESLSLREIAAKVEMALKMPLKAQWGAREYTPGVQMDPSLPYPALPDWKAQISLDQGLVEVTKTC